MRILIDYRPALRNRTGVGEYIHRLALALGHQPSDGDRFAEPDDVTIFSSSWKDRLEVGALPGIRCIDRRIPVRVLTRLWNRLGWPPIETLTGEPFDVVHSPSPLLVPSQQAAQVVTIHDLDFLAHPERTYGEMRRDFPHLVRVHAERAHRVIVSSRYAAGQVQRLLEVRPEKIALCPPGAPDWSPRRMPAQSGYILFVGTLEPRKNVGALLRAYAILTSRNVKPPELVLAGRISAGVQDWLAALKRPPLAGRARHVGYVPDEQRRSVFEGASVLVVPSLEEGFGLPVLEAMTVGVPVVASNRGSLPEVLGDAGILVDPDDVEELADAVGRVVTDPDLASQLAARGLERARAFTWTAAAGAAREAYRAAIAARRIGH